MATWLKHSGGAVNVDHITDVRVVEEKTNFIPRTWRISVIVGDYAQKEITIAGKLGHNQAWKIAGHLVGRLMSKRDQVIDIDDCIDEEEVATCEGGCS